MSDATLQVPRPRVLPAVLIAIALGSIGAASVSMAHSMGYDEAMHAELPAARMAVALKMGEEAKFFDALLGCEQYPFGYPALLAIVQLFTGISEFACRASGRVVWAVALLGIFLVAREVALGASRERARRGGSFAGDDTRLSWAPWIAMGLAALSPLALEYSGTLFLEIPFTAVAVFATLAWLRRRVGERERRARGDVIAGALLAASVFTKFNYGGLLALGCAIDFGVEGVQAVRGKEVRDWLGSAARLSFVPALICLWWFVLPFPGGSDTAASHRGAFLGFLQGNQQYHTPFAQRLFDWGAGLFITPRTLFLACIAAIVALRFWCVHELRTIAILGLACTVPVALHPFHLDRFLLPGAPFVWVLSGLGLSSVFPRAPKLRAIFIAALLALCVVRPDLDTRPLMERCSPTTDPRPELVEYRRQVLAEKISLAPGRILRTAGLPRAESDAVLDAIATEAGPSARIGWLAAVEKLPPGALQVGLLARGGSRARLLDDPTLSMLFGVDGVDPGWDNARLSAACAPFEVIFASDPANALGANAWSFLGGYRERLAKEPGYTQKEFATVVLHPPLGKDREVRLIALRRTP